MKVYVIYFTDRNGELLGVKLEEAAALEAIRAWHQMYIDDNRYDDLPPGVPHTIAVTVQKRSEYRLQAVVVIDGTPTAGHNLDIIETDDPLLDI